MRTPEQIANLKKVFVGMYGLYAFFMTSEDINKMADLLQQKAVGCSEWTWEIKIRTNEDFSKKWSEIKKEPKTPRCTLRSISLKVEELFPKYPNILSVLITAKEDGDLTFEFNSNGHS